MTIQEAIKHFQSYPPETPCAFALWLPDDAQQVAQENDLPPLTDAQVAESLADMHQHHDASVGFNWDTLEYYVLENSKPN